MCKKMKMPVGKTGLLSLCLLFAMTMAVFILPVAQRQVFAAENTTEFAGGDGTEGNPYQVSTAEQLNNVRNYLDAYFIQAADIDLTAATAEGGAFYNDGSGWSPIGTDDSTAFTGNYDGGGYRIIGLKSKQGGLFGYNQGVIHNLGMENGAVSSSSSDAGGIAGYNYGSISNCYNTGAVSGSDDYAGGIGGYNYGSINNCYNTGTVSSSYSFSDVGGIAGYNDGTISNCYNIGAMSALHPASDAGGIAGENYGTISNCYNTGAVSSSSSFAGGIAGRNDDGSISNCYNTGAVSSSSSAGGITGYNWSGSITNCYYYDALNLNNEGGIPLPLEALKQQASYDGFAFDTVWTMDADSYYPFPTLRGITPPAQEEENITEFAGGTGRLENPYQVSTPEQLNNVRNYLDSYFIQTAELDLTEATAEGGAFYNDGSGWSPIGTFGGNYDGGGYRIIGLKSKQSGNAGLFGYNKGVIRNLGMENGAVSSSSSYAGGIAGYNYYGTIPKCYNTGAVSGRYAGGITGRNDNGRISKCYNTGEITVDSDTGTVYAGGIAGYSTGEIADVFNTGKVTAQTGGTDKFAYAGGLAGYTEGGGISYGYSTGEVQGSPQYTGKVVGSNEDSTFSRLYFIGTYDDMGVGNTGNSKDKVEPKTAEQMKQQATYVGFDFNTVWGIWSISPDENGGYPMLRGLPAPGEPDGTAVTVTLSEKSYDAETGTYHLAIALNNQGEQTLAGTILVAAYDETRLVGMQKYPIGELAADGSQTVPAEITTAKKATQLKVFFWDTDTLQPLGNAPVTEG